MSRYLPYSPDQGYLVPPRVDEVLDADHLCFFIHRVVERLDLGRFEESYSAEGGMLYHPSLMLKVWLYAYTLGVTSSRRVEQRIREDLAFRYLAGNARPDYWALNAFRRRHGRAINDCFTQVVEMARGLGLRQLGTVAIDATRIKASASPDKVVKIARGERARTRLKVRRWQQACDADDPNENAGSSVGAAIETVEQVELGRDLAPLPRPRRGVLRQSATDPDARFLRARGGRFVLGYTGEIAVSEDHLIVAQRVTAQSTDNASLVPMVELVNTSCGSPPERVIADSGYYSNHNTEQMEALGIDAYVPDSNLARELNLGHKADDVRCHDPSLRRMREKMRSEQGRRLYRKRKSIVEPVFGVLKQQRGLREFRLRSLDKVAIEFALAATAYNLTRIYRSR
jgi:transposase